MRFIIGLTYQKTGTLKILDIKNSGVKTVKHFYELCSKLFQLVLFFSNPAYNIGVDYYCKMLHEEVIQYSTFSLYEQFVKLEMDSSPH